MSRKWKLDVNKDTQQAQSLWVSWTGFSSFVEGYQVVHLEAMLWMLVLQWMSTYKLNEAIDLNFSGEYSPAGCFQRIQLLLLLYVINIFSDFSFFELIESEVIGNKYYRIANSKLYSWKRTKY